MGIRLHLSAVALPEGAFLVAYDPANPVRTAAPVTAGTLSNERDAWTHALFTERVVLECQLPPGADSSAVSFTVAELSHQYRAMLLNAETKAESCENDATCYPAWAQQEEAVARIQFIDSGDTYECSGCLLNHNDANTIADYFLTANHCVGSQTVANTLELYWLYQTTVCDQPSTAPYFYTMPYTQGGTLLATSPASTGNDFSFLQLPEAPPGGTYYAGWSTALPTASEQLTVLHHPGNPPGDYTRISFGNVQGTTNLATLAGYGQEGQDNAWVTQWYSGTTEGGSSGSPLFDANQAVIGQLYGGDAMCSGISEFGRFDVTYDSIKQWIDPLSQNPPGQSSYQFTNPQLWDFSGTYNSTDNGDTTTDQLVQQANGQITGTHTEVDTDNGDYLEFSAYATGRVFSTPQAIGFQFAWKGTISGTLSDGAAVSGTGAAHGKANLVPSLLTVEADYTARACIQGGRCETTTQSSQAALPSGMTGDWDLEIDLVPQAAKLTGTAVVTLSNGRTLSYSVTGHYNAKLQLTVLSLTGQGNAHGTFLSVTASGPNLSLTKLSGSVLGQKLKWPQ